MFSYEIFENFKNTHFEEHLPTAVPGRPRKIKAGKWHIEQQILFIKNMNLMKFVRYSRYIKMLFIISFRPQKRAKLIMITILKYLEPPTVVEQF